MKTTTLLITLILGLMFVTAALGQARLYVSPDVPTDPGIGFNIHPWDVIEHTGGSYAAAASFTAPGNPEVDAIHRLDKPGHWLFSLEVPGNLGGALTADAEPRDVLRDSAGAYSFHFCGGSVIGAVPLYANVDAVYTDASSGGDSGDLILSFDVPTSIAGTTFDPADLVRYTRTVIPGGCSDWQLVGVEFDASAAGAGIPVNYNVIGADRIAGETVLVLDIPGDLVPTTGPATYIPGNVVAWDGVSFKMFDTLGGWPVRSEVDALSCQANPGRVRTLLLGKSTLTAGDLTLSWTPSCSTGAEDYSIYRGTLGSWTSHVQVDCHDDFGDLTEEVLPMAADAYYLVVPDNQYDEGTYGAQYSGGIYTERPQPGALADRCVISQQITACP